MLNRTLIAATLAVASLITIQGCAVTRDQETMGAYIDDATITTQVKAKFVGEIGFRLFQPIEVVGDREMLGRVALPGRHSASIGLGPISHPSSPPK